MWEFLKSVLGVSRNFPSEPSQSTVHPLWNEGSSSSQHEQSEIQHLNPFSVITNPFEIHKYFEKHMDEMMKGMIHFRELPVQDAQDFHQFQSESENLRDSFLKPGYSERQRSADVDLDGRINSTDIQEFFEGHQQLKEPEERPKVSFRSVTVHTVRQPDGTVKTVQTVRDHTGRVETTVSTHAPDQPIISGPNLQDESLFSNIFPF